jgi:hypothetical protein
LIAIFLAFHRNRYDDLKMIKRKQPVAEIIIFKLKPFIQADHSLGTGIEIN